MMAAAAAGCPLTYRPRTPPPRPPTPTPTPTPTPNPTPEAEATPGGNDAAAQAANEAEQKARQAARKAAEAAAVAAEASNAAREAAKAAAKAVAASKSHSGTGRKPTQKASPRPSESAGLSPTPTPSPSAQASIGETLADLEHKEEAQKKIDSLAERIKKINRAKLGVDDSRRYDLAAGLLTSARSALSRSDYMAAVSLADKAKVLIDGIPH